MGVTLHTPRPKNESTQLPEPTLASPKLFFRNVLGKFQTAPTVVATVPWYLLASTKKKKESRNIATLEENLESLSYRSRMSIPTEWRNSSLYKNISGEVAWSEGKSLSSGSPANWTSVLSSTQWRWHQLLKKTRPWGWKILHTEFLAHSKQAINGELYHVFF